MRPCRGTASRLRIATDALERRLSAATAGRQFPRHQRRRLCLWTAGTACALGRGPLRRQLLDAITRRTAGRAPAAGAMRLRCTAEHLVARSSGGEDTPSNIVAACAHCNHTRHRRESPPTPEEYLAEVIKRVRRNGWHHKWVFELGLLDGRSGRRGHTPQPASMLKPTVCRCELHGCPDLGVGLPLETIAAKVRPERRGPA